MINVESNNIDEINLEVNRLFKLKQSVISDITEIARDDIESNLMKGISFDGSAIKPKKYDNSKAIFRNDEILIFSVMKKVNSDYGEVFLDDIRSDIGMYLQYGTSRMPTQRKFFGISSRINSAIENYFNYKTITELFE